MGTEARTRYGRIHPRWPAGVPRLPLAVAALAIGALAWAWRAAPVGLQNGDLAAVLGAASLAGAVVAAYWFPLHLAPKVKIYLASVPYFLLAVLVVPPLAATAAALGALAGEWSVRAQRGNGLGVIVTEGGRRALVVLAGALVAHLRLFAAWYPLAWVGAALVLGAGDIVTCPLVLVPLRGQPPGRLIVSVARDAAVEEAVQYALGLLGALAALQARWAPLLLVPPLALAYAGFKHAHALQERTLEAQQMAEEALRARDTFLAAVAHDLKTPLTIITMQATALEHQGHQPADSSAAAIRTAGGHMARVLDELLDLAHLQAGRTPVLERQEIDLVALADRLAQEYQRTTRRHRIAVRAAVPAVVGHWDRARLERVLANLLANALKYSPAGGDIVVAIRPEGPGDRRTGPGVRLEVLDRGIGIPATDLPRVFERFHRDGNVGHLGGSGLGLAGAREIVEQHGGTLTVRNRPGGGTMATLWLPLTGERPAGQGDAARS